MTEQSLRSVRQNTRLIPFPVLTNDEIFRSSIRSRRFLASGVTHAQCGVTMQFASPVRGLSRSGGSLHMTSSAAPESLPSVRASARSASFTTAPREVLMRYAPLFIFAMKAELTSPRVSSVRGQWRETKSDSQRSVSLSVYSMPSEIPGTAERR